MKTALYGGSFNPIHFGHLLSAKTVIEFFNYDKIVFIPASTPVHKDNSDYVSNLHRENMIKLAIENEKQFQYSDCELKRGGLSYTIDTVRYYYENYNITDKIGVIIGDDLIEGLDKWKEIETLQSIADIICLQRDDIKKTSKFKINFIKNRIFEISSKEIRDLLNNNKSINYLLPERVIDYINQNKLYYK